jgi:formate dehydrogenase beta subunit
MLEVKTMSRISLTIDGQKVEAEEGATVLEAAQKAGIYIPALCAHPAESPFACRLCIVEIEGRDDFPTACTTPVAEGMVVSTNTPQLNELRRRSLERILAEHPNACLTCHRLELCDRFRVCLRTVAVLERCVVCPKNGRCELQKAARFVGLEEVVIPYAAKDLPIERGEPLFDRDYNLCILCGQCVAVCHELRGVEAISFTYQDGRGSVGPASGGSLKESGCKFCCACVEVCPTGALMDRDDKWEPWTDREAALVPCRHACPAGIDVPRYVRLIGEGKFAEALAVVREKVPFPATLGRVCFHPCEDKCRRNELDESIAIKSLKRFAAEHENGLWKLNSKQAPATGKRVAIVGAGPAGLTAAYYLAKLGHSVTVFEALPQPGGMMRVGIPEYRLPRHILDAEINTISEVGVDIKTNTKVESLDELFEQGYNAIFLALGAHRGTKLGAEGEDLPGVIDALTFLRDVSLGEEVKVGNRIAVIGGGNSAMDAARSALRLGAEKVTILYRRTRAEMPASPEEVQEGIHEGAEIIFLITPVRISRENGALRVECIRMRLGEPDASGRRRPEPIPGSEVILEFDAMIGALGQMPEVPAQFGLRLGRGDRIQADGKTLATSREGVFAGGDAVTGPASVIEAIAAGRKAAISIDKYLGGEGAIEEVLVQAEKPSPCLGRDEGFADKARVQMSSLASEQRLGGFAEVELGFDEEMAIAEAKRCLQCDLRLQIAKEMSLPVKAKSVLNLER